MRENPVKASLVPHIPEIIETGAYLGRQETPEHKKYPAFHTKFKEVEADGKRIKAMLDVGEKSGGVCVYSLNHEGSPTWEHKKRRLREMEEQGKLSGGAGTKIPGLDTTFVRRGTPLRSVRNPGFFKDNLGDAAGEVNLFILEVVDIATGKRLPEYEDT
jgi:hypothetical protein